MRWLTGLRLVRARSERQISARRLEILTGTYPDASRATAGSLPSLPGPVPAGLPAELLSRCADE